MLEYNTHFIFISGTNESSVANLKSTKRNLIKSNSEIRKDITSQTVKQPKNFEVANPIRYSTILTLHENNLTAQEYLGFLEELRKKNSDLIISPFINQQGKKEEKAGVSDYLLVKLHQKEDFSLLMEKVKKYNLELIGYNEYRPHWFTLAVNPDGLTTLKTANLLYETGLFIQVEPDLIGIEKNNFYNKTIEKMDIIPNDIFYGDQWYLNNTGQHFGIQGIDIDAEQAWNIETGDPNIIVAIVDDGVEKFHPDLDGNIWGTGYNAHTGSSSSTLYGNHGTACAGLVVGEGNNIEGISGVAPNASVMPISISYQFSTLSKFATGIDVAVANGVDVISNSWTANFTSQNLDDAIEEALTDGRGGLGCVVVFAAGNDFVDGAQYPANSNPDIICVGAIDRCGVRSGREDISPHSCDPWGPNSKPGSSYGDPIDIVAGGSSISTTDRLEGKGYNSGGNGNYANNDYTNGFGGTSAACPIVAGVAALILSANPNLTALQVNDIIESTAQKVRTDIYDYNNINDRPNGTWCNVTGYGHVNAHAALLEALPSCPVNTTTGVTVTGTQTLQVQNTITSSATLTSTSNVNYLAGSKIKLIPGFKARGRFKAQIASCQAGGVNRSVSPEKGNIIEYVYSAEMEKGDENKLSTNNKRQSQQEGIVLNEFQNTLSVMPNPIRGNATIKVQVEQSNTTSIFISDITGKKVKTVLLNQYLDKGSHEFEMNLSNLSNGLYLCTLQTDSNSQTIKISLMN